MTLYIKLIKLGGILGVFFFAKIQFHRDLVGFQSIVREEKKIPSVHPELKIYPATAVPHFNGAKALGKKFLQALLRCHGNFGSTRFPD